MTTPLSSIGLISVGAFLGSLSALGFKAGAKRLEPNFASLMRNWPLAAGVAGYLVSTGFFVAGLKNGELSILFPMVSTGYIWTMIWSRVFLQEPFTRGKVVGLGLILLGCMLLGLGTRQTT